MWMMKVLLGEILVFLVWVKCEECQGVLSTEEFGEVSLMEMMKGVFVRGSSIHNLIVI